MNYRSTRRFRPTLRLVILLLCSALLLPTFSLSWPRTAAATPLFPDAHDRLAPATGAGTVERAETGPPCDLSNPNADSDGDGIPNGVEPAENRNPCLKDNDIFTSARLFVQQQYRDFLGREGEAGGVDYWTGQITAGLQTRAQIIESFFNSAEFSAVKPVTRLYFAYFLRIPDYVGLQYWVAQFRSGVSLAVISQAFAASPEFQQRYGSLSNADFVTLLYRNVLGREPDSQGQAFWTGHLNSGALTRGQLMLEFSESVEYQGRSRNWVYVVQMYVGMLRRAPEQLGFDYWVGQMNGGRSGLDLNSSFLAAPEYHDRFLPVAGQATNYAEAMVDPFNRTGLPGEDLLSRNFNWSLPLLNLAGRSGLDLELSLTYNSLVWTRSGSSITFNADQGYPAPGFRLGFPVIQAKYLNAQVGALSYLLITPSGYRIELRQLGSSTTYESADSSYVQFLEGTAGNPSVLLTPDGARMDYYLFGGAFRCAKITDRNGNYLTAAYHSDGRLGSVTDTLGRVISFHYNGDQTLASISQIWNGQPHYWATFSYATLALQPNFSIAIEAPSSIPALSRVTLDDGSYMTFQYSVWGQVYRINEFAPDNHLLNYVSYNLPTTTATSWADGPHFTERKDWAENWNGGAPVVTSFQFDTAARSFGQVTAPDGTSDKEIFHTTGYRRGLVAEAQVISSGQIKKRTTLEWTQDNTGLAYRQNPRVTEANVYDEASNRRRTTVSYTSFGLPSDVYEYDQSATNVLRRTHTDYNVSSTYINATRRLIGLATSQTLYDGASGALVSRLEFAYDLSGQLDDQGEPVQHDASYNQTFLQGRGNRCRVRRYDVTNSTFVESSFGYNTAGSQTFMRDPLNHQTTLSYTDSFSDGQNHNTLAYVTRVIDAGGFAATSQYQFDLGAVSQQQDAKGAAQAYQYDAAGRLERLTNLVNGAYTRVEYASNHTLVNRYTTVVAGQGEAYSVEVLDGVGRVRYAASEFPNSAGGYRSVHTIYDDMGRVWKQSNPTETFSNWAAAGDDATTGWVYRQQIYDWQGRPLVMTNPDGTSQEQSYSGCGCAGGAVVTMRDEEGRRQKLYTDVLGRVVKTEILHADLSIYATTTTEYNARDQETRVRQYQGAAVANCPTGSCQETVFTYDGHGRLKTQRLPIETNPTSYDYHADDTMQKRTDARGASITYTYDARRLVTSIVHTKPAQSALAPENGPLAVHKGTDATFGYDEAGNRLWMQETNNGVTIGRTEYTYDTLSQRVPAAIELDIALRYASFGKLA